MKKIWIQGSLTGLLFGTISGIMVAWLAAGGVAVSADYPGLVGLWESEIIEETYDISVGLDGLGKPRPAKGHVEQRIQLLLPQHYGNLVTITGNGTSAIMWYQDGMGVIRNAIIPDANQQAVRILLQNTNKLKQQVVRN